MGRVLGTEDIEFPMGEADRTAWRIWLARRGQPERTLLGQVMAANQQDAVHRGRLLAEADHRVQHGSAIDWTDHTLEVEQL